MKLVTEHLGEIILAIAGVALIVGLILAFRTPIAEFFDGILDKLTGIGDNGGLSNINSTLPSTIN